MKNGKVTKRIDLSKIDLEAYKKELTAATRNEKIWAMGALDPNTEAMHLENYEKLQEEMRLFTEGKYQEILELYPDSSILSTYIQNNA